MFKKKSEPVIAPEHPVNPEPRHVYQNRGEIYDLQDMYLCPTCNGFYGVPHDFDHEAHNLVFTQSGQCACRFHRERDGLPREGSFGWIMGPR